MSSLWKIITGVNWLTVGQWCGVIAATITFLVNLGKIVAWIRKVCLKLSQKLTRYQPRVPRESLRFVLRPHQSWWSMGSSGNEPAMQAVCDWYISNITDEAVKVCGARVRKPNIHGHIAVRHPESDYYGDYYIPPKFTTDGRADFWIQPPIKKVGEPLVLDLEFLDQYGNVHCVKKVEFRSPQPRKVEINLPLESIASISDPIEKEIITILQNETFRYKDCGRRVGGLGSVTLVYQGRRFNGVGTDGSIAGSSEQQSIVIDPQNAKFDSDNGRLLIGYYQTLGVSEILRFNDVLLSRISRDTAYADIGYFILYVGYRVGLLRDVMERAKHNLKGDLKFGFSDLLRLLDGILKYEYSTFSSEALDDIEHFIEGLGGECVFRIPERIRAIRAYLLLQRISQ